MHQTVTEDQVYARFCFRHMDKMVRYLTDMELSVLT